MSRPRKYSTVKQLQKAIDDYFTQCEPEFLRDEDGTILTDKRGNPKMLRVGKPPTITGLALALGLSGRQALLNYAERPEFVDAITHARMRVEAFAEESLFDRGAAQGAKFNLMNNFGWREKTDNVTRSVQTYTDEEAEHILRQYYPERENHDG